MRLGIVHSSSDSGAVILGLVSLHSRDVGVGREISGLKIFPQSIEAE